MYGLQKKNTLESFRCWDEDDYQYLVLSSALVLTKVILAGNRDSRRHSTMSFRKNAGECLSGRNKLLEV